MRKLLLLCFLVAICGLLGIPNYNRLRHPVKTHEMIRDILSFNGAIVGYSLLSSGYASGVGLELKQNGDFSRGVKEFFRFWDYEYRIPEAKAQFKRKNLLIAHPLMGYEFSNYLLSKGYTKKRTLLVTGLSVYLLEKGIQGSFERTFPTSEAIISTISSSSFFPHHPSSGITVQVNPGGLNLPACMSLTPRTCRF